MSGGCVAFIDHLVQVTSNTRATFLVTGCASRLEHRVEKLGKQVADAQGVQLIQVLKKPSSWTPILGLCLVALCRVVNYSPSATA